MKYRNIILFAICIVALTLGVGFLLVLIKHNAKNAKIQRIPEVTLTTTDGEIFSLAKLKPDCKTAVLFFGTECEFCKKEIEEIIANRGAFVGVEWVFVTISPIEELRLFLGKYQMDLIPGAKICIEYFPELHIAMDVTTPPSLFVYDTNGNIEHFRRGAVSIKEILEWLK